MIREIEITKELLQEIYDSIRSSEQRFKNLADALTDFSSGEFRVSIYDTEMGRTIRKFAVTLLGDERSDDFLYLLDECPLMDGGGSITLKDGKTYRIQTIDDLWDYWESEGLL